MKTEKQTTTYYIGDNGERATATIKDDKIVIKIVKPLEREITIKKEHWQWFFTLLCEVNIEVKNG